MSRPLRLEFPGAFYHITSRGDRREPVYLNQTDFEDFLDLFSDVCERYHWRCHAYCLMTNHYHLLIESIDGNLSAGMRHLNGVYTQRFNKRHQHVGHVFQGRFKAILVDVDTYLLELARYVVLNPVRADMVKTAGQWAWSSYHSMIGKQHPPAWLETNRLLLAFSEQRTHAQQAYIEFVATAPRQSNIWKNLRHQIYLGDKDFVTHMQAHIDNARQSLEIPILQRREPARALNFYEDKFGDNKQAMRAAYATGQYTLKVIADYFKVHYSTVSRAVNSIKAN